MMTPFIQARSHIKILLIFLIFYVIQFEHTHTLAEEPIGRFFYSPEQRQQLDVLRGQKAYATQMRDEAPAEIVTYNGMIRRSDGQTTVWINDEPIADSAMGSKNNLNGRINRQGQVILNLPQSRGATVQLKVGQSAHLQSGRISESPSKARQSNHDLPNASNQSPSNSMPNTLEPSNTVNGPLSTPSKP